MIKRIILGIVLGSVGMLVAGYIDPIFHAGFIYKGSIHIVLGIFVGSVAGILAKSHKKIILCSLLGGIGEIIGSFIHWQSLFYLHSGYLRYSDVIQAVSLASVGLFVGIGYVLSKKFNTVFHKLFAIAGGIIGGIFGVLVIEKAVFQPVLYMFSDYKLTAMLGAIYGGSIWAGISIFEAIVIPATKRHCSYWVYLGLAIGSFLSVTIILLFFLCRQG